MGGIVMSLGHCVITWLVPGAGVAAGHPTISIWHQRLHRGMPCDMVGPRNGKWLVWYFEEGIVESDHLIIGSAGGSSSKIITWTTQPVLHIKIEPQC